LSRRRVKRSLKRISLTVEKDLVEWLDNMVQAEVFINRSQGISLALRYLKAYYEKEKKIPEIS